MWLRARPGTADGLFAALVGLLLGLPSVAIAWLSVDHTSALLMLGGAAVAHVALVWRRSRPVASTAVAGGVVLAMLLTWQWFILLPSCLVALVSIYACTAHARRLRPSVVLLLSVAGCVLVGVRYTVAPPVPDAAALLAVLLTAGVVAAWGLGLLRRSQFAQVGLLEQRLRDAAAERERRTQAARAAERARIARDVHDVVAHSLAVIVNQAKGGQYLTRRQATGSARCCGPSRTPAGRPSPNCAAWSASSVRTRATGSRSPAWRGYPNSSTGCAPRAGPWRSTRSAHAGHWGQGANSLSSESSRKA